MGMGPVEMSRLGCVVACVEVGVSGCWAERGGCSEHWVLWERLSVVWSGARKRGR